MKETISAMSRTRNALMLKVVKTKKEETSLPGEDTMVTTRDGRLSTLTKPLRNQLKVSTRSMECTSTDHSILSQDFG
jgi:hypothetical protein